MKNVIMVFLLSILVSGCSSNDEVIEQSKITNRDGVCALFTKLEMSDSFKDLILKNITEYPDLRNDITQIAVFNTTREEYCLNSVE